MFSFTKNFFLLFYIFYGLISNVLWQMHSIYSHIIYISHEDMKWSFVPHIVLKYACFYIPVTDAWKTNFISNPIAFNSCFSSYWLCVHKFNVRKNSCCHCCPCTLLFECLLLLYVSPKLWKLKNLCAWTTFFFSPR